jgi:hypothetical protein
MEDSEHRRLLIDSVGSPSLKTRESNIAVCQGNLYAALVRCARRHNAPLLMMLAWVAKCDWGEGDDGDEYLPRQNDLAGSCLGTCASYTNPCPENRT